MSTKKTKPLFNKQTETIPLKSFLEIPYVTLEEMNLAAKAKRDTVSPEKQEQEYKSYLAQEKTIKAVTLCFTDIEGKFHMLDYDKKFLLNAYENLTFDGSSIRGFSAQKESDLRLQADWTSIVWLPSDIVGAGRVFMFANVLDCDRKQYHSDFRGVLQQYTQTLRKEQKLSALVSAEIEGFLLDGICAEQLFTEQQGFSLVTSGGYYHCLPLDKLRQFIDTAAEAQRAMGFQNEKDHPEVAPSQFEINFSYTDILRACDQIQLYKLVCRQVANKMGLTASFLPKPMMGVNGSGMHINLSLAKNGKNIFYDKTGEANLSSIAWDFIYRTLNHANDISLLLNSSVNAYRRLDPHFEAPNQIKVSSNDRGSMIRIPAGNEKSTRIEVRSVAPDANPYLAMYALLKTGLTGEKMPVNKIEKAKYLPGNINDALEIFKASRFIEQTLGAQNKEKYYKLKKATADRCPRELGTRIKTSEIIFHHEITNQVLWNCF